MNENSYRFIGCGIYTIPEASRLTGVSPWRIRRWLKGYSFRTRDSIHTSAPLVRYQLAKIDHNLALSFQDLLEVRFVDAFIKRGVSWKTLRLAVERGRELVRHSHPFSTGSFWTDGRTILLELGKRDRALLDVVSNQMVFRAVIESFLSQLDFEGDQAVRWWPMGREREVVIDPERSFGQPVVNKEGVPTAVLARAYRTDKSLGKIKTWFEVSEGSVKDAIEFERRLAA